MSTADVEAVAIQTKGATSQSGIIIHLTSMQVLREALTGHGWEALLKNLEK